MIYEFFRVLILVAQGKDFAFMEPVVLLFVLIPVVVHVELRVRTL